MDLGVNGHTAIITGGAQGIGFATAQILIDEGANVVIADIKSDLAIEAARRLNRHGAGKALAVTTDITKETQVAHLVKTTRSEFRSAQMLIHCAAIIDDKTFLQSSP